MTAIDKLRSDTDHARATNAYVVMTPAEAQAVLDEIAQVSPEIARLMKFYSASTIDELIAKQEEHVRKLQERLPPLRDTQPGPVRA